MDKGEASAPSAEMPKPSMKKKGLGGSTKLIIIGCVVLGGCLVALLLGGTVFAFFSNKNVPVFSDVVETVENTVATESMTDEAIEDDINDFVFSMLASTATEDSSYTKEEAEALINNKFEADNFRFEADLNADMGDSGSIDLALDGFTRKIDDKAAYDANVSGTYSVQGADMDFAGEVRSKDDTMYLYVSELSEVLGQSLGVDAAMLTEQWFSMDASSSTDTVSGLGVDQTLPTDAGSGMTKEDLENLQELIYSDEMGALLERVDDEVIEGVRTNCFKMIVDQAGAESLMTKAGEIWEEEVTESDLAGLGLDGSTITLNVCSGRQDGNIYKADMKVDYDDGTSMALNLKLWDYDKVEDDVEVPADAVSFEDYFTQMYMQQLGALEEQQTQQDELEQLLQQYDTEDYENIDWESLGY